MTTGSVQSAGVAGRAVRLGPPPAPPATPSLAADQQQVVDLPAGSGPVVVTGGPGTGKTLVVVESVVARVHRDGLDPGSVLVLAPSRRAAAQLRDRVSLRLAGQGAPAVQEPLARTPASYAFGLIRRHARLLGEPVPRLISGPEQDDILRDLLAGHVVGDGRSPHWPAELADALQLDGFRHELRDLLMRALERGLEPPDLDELGRRHNRPFWRAAARVFQEYLEVTALASPGGYDPAAIVDHAATLLGRDDELLAAERARVRFVAVDDHQESGEALARLLDQLCGHGGDLLLAGDPDVTVGGFRGASPQLIAEAAQRHRQRDGNPAAVHVLTGGRRLSPQVAGVAERVVGGIGALGPHAAARRRHLGRQAPEEAEAEQQVRVAVLRSGASEAAFIAEHLRRAHLSRGLGWDRMAVIVRSGGQATALNRALSQAGVPVVGGVATVPLRDEPAVRLISSATRAAAELAQLRATDTARQPPSEELTERLVQLLRQIGGLDQLALARLARALTQTARGRAQGQTTAELLVELLLDLDEELITSLDEGSRQAVRRVGLVLSAGSAALADQDGPDVVLWSVWQATGFAGPWRARALDGGRRGRRADRDLDALMTLFAVAERFAERSPGADVLVLLDQLDRQDLPEDSVADRAPEQGNVTVATPQQAVGLEWDLVVVAGVQEGVWPNTRLRGSLLDAPGLVDAVAGNALEAEAGRRAAHAAVMTDELRMFYLALTRTRGSLLVTAVSGAEVVPSDLVGLVDPELPEDAVHPAPRPMSLAGVVAHARGILLTALQNDDPPRAQRAAALLATLAADRVPGADPAQWYRSAGLSDSGALVREGERVRVSPSSIETQQRCALRWLLTTRADANTPLPPQVALGTLVHDLANTMPDAHIDDLLTALDDRWAEVDAPAGWLGDQLHARGQEMLRKFTGYRNSSDSGRVLAREVPVEVALVGENGERIALRGQIDRVEDAGGGRVVVVDLKTGSSAPARADLPRHPQLGTYQFAVDAGALNEALGDPATSAGARLVQLGGKTQKAGVQDQPAVDADQDPGWARDLVLRAAAGMSGAVFPATLNEQCRSCPVRSSCPLQPEGRHL